jgi:hypothetical protein
MGNRLMLFLSQDGSYLRLTMLSTNLCPLNHVGVAHDRLFHSKLLRLNTTHCDVLIVNDFGHLDIILGFIQLAWCFSIL